MRMPVRSGGVARPLIGNPGCMITVTMRRLLQPLLPRDHASLDDHKRGAERIRRAVLTSGVAMLARVVQIGTLLVTVRLTLKYLGNERFGLWMTISSVLAMAAFAAEATTSRGALV